VSEPRKPGFWSHWPALTATLAALVTAAGTLIGSLAAAGVIGGGDGGGGDTTVDTTTDGSVVHGLPFEPTPDELRLAQMIPLVHQSDCERVRDLPANSEAGIFCRPTGAAGLAYHLYASAPALNAYMKDRLALGDQSKQCGHAASGSSTYQNVDKETIGRLVCYVEEGQAWIEWSNLEGNVYAYAFRTDDDWKALFNFWTGAGPNT
jgi:hypothetical protein